MTALSCKSLEQGNQTTTSENVSLLILKLSCARLLSLFPRWICNSSLAEARKTTHQGNMSYVERMQTGRAPFLEAINNTLSIMAPHAQKRRPSPLPQVNPSLTSRSKRPLNPWSPGRDRCLAPPSWPLSPAEGPCC